MLSKARLAVSVVMLASIACGAAGATTPLEATLNAMSGSVRQTATAAAAGALNPDSSVATAQSQATASSQSDQATQAANAALSDQAKAATQQAFAPILAELPKYGVDPNSGTPGWIHPPATLEVKGYMKYDYINRFIATVAKDFVVSSDIYWDTQYGTSGCGFVLRSDGNKNALNQYMAILTRGASGHLVFAIMSKGQVVSGRDIYAYGRDPNFVWGNKVTNRLTVVGRGNIFTIFTNGTKIGKIDVSAPPPLPSLPNPPKKPDDPLDVQANNDYQQQLDQYNQVSKEAQKDYEARQQSAANANTIFERGFIALVVLSESGRTQCQFNNTWLFLIN